MKNGNPKIGMLKSALEISNVHNIKFTYDVYTKQTIRP